MTEQEACFATALQMTITTTTTQKMKGQISWNGVVGVPREAGRSCRSCLEAVPRKRNAVQ